MSRLSARTQPLASTEAVEKPVPPTADAAVAYERIWGAIIDHSLPPGTRLVEDKLCDIFGIGRTRIRQVLQRLAHEGMVTLMPNRGAMVSQPSVQEARDIFEARRVLEAGIVSKFLGKASKADMRRLREHVTREKAAFRANNYREIIKLSGDFHLLIAELAGNATMLALLRELVSQTSLILAVYQAPGAMPCPPDEHQELRQALERGDPAAIDLIRQHLQHVEDDLNLVERGDGGIDLKLVLAHES